MREVALQLGPLAIRWYGVLWMAALALAWYLLPRLQKYRDLQLSKDGWWYVLTAGLVGAVVGGRLGYVLLWEPGYFLAHPAEIFSIWDGGMSSHGGFVGVGLVLWWVSKKLKINFWALLDVVVIPVALGLALGRVGNFINQELFNPPELAWLAVGKNLVIAAACFAYLRLHPSGPSDGPPPLRKGRKAAEQAVSPSKTFSPLRRGSTEQQRGVGVVFALFLILYGILRFLVEFVRVQEFPGAFGLTRGQLFTLPVILVGGLLLLWRLKRERKPERAQKRQRRYLSNAHTEL